MKRLLFIVIVLLRLNIYAQNVQRPNIILIMSDDIGVFRHWLLWWRN